MSMAGASAGKRARHLSRAAETDPANAAALLAASGRFSVAEQTEAQTMRLVSELATDGFQLLPDRRWPGSRTAQVDLVVVGRSGVFIVDTKAWRDFSVQGGRPHRGQDDVTDEFESLSALLAETQEAFAEVGLPPSEVHCIAAMSLQPRIATDVGTVEVVGAKKLVERLRRPGGRLNVADVDKLAAVARDYFAVIVDPEDGPSALQIDADEDEVVLDLEEFHRGLLHLDEAPIETWMSFLDPAQAKIARRSFNGPARIRGAAGTGKTVVGLHRTAHLARAATDKVLVTTYVKSFPAVLKSLLERLEPVHAPKVEFASVHSVAVRLLRERGRQYSIAEDQQITDLFGQAWSSTPWDSPLRATRFGLPYWREEIEHVIKGRGLSSFEDYASLARVGRKYPLAAELRERVWELAEKYDRLLRAAGVVDWADIGRMARDELRERPLHRYEAVVIDEAQDLSCVTVGMLHALVGDRRDGLTLIGDGQQSIYPGGYTLGEIGISLAGRGVILDVNHRNTRQIADFARRLVEDDIVTDIEGTDAAGDTVAAITRTGPQPVLRHFTEPKDLDRALVAAVRSAVRGGTRTGDIGILAPTNAAANRVIGILRQERLPAASIERYTGQTTSNIKVGTIKRAKGLEFKHVFLTDIPARLLAQELEAENESALERRRLDLRELYVGMTRARDQLWVGVSN